MADPATRDTLERCIKTVRRVQTDRALAAMSLACHVYRFDNGRWPASAEELVPKYLPALPKDPTAGDEQSLNYALVKAGLPDGSDRPLVFSKAGSKDSLVYRADAPQYSYYTDGPRNALQRGQFRDVARWTPLIPPDPNNPVTRPLP